MQRSTLIAAVTIASAIGFVIYQKPWLDDSDRIRQLLERSVAAFNTRDLSCTDALHPTFVDKTSGTRYDRLRAAIAWLVVQDMRKPGSTKNWALEIEFAPDDSGIEVHTDSATTRFRLELFDTGEVRENPVWSLDVTAHLENDDEGWRVHESAHVTLVGRRPW